MVERCVFAVWIGHEVPISDGETDAVEAHDLLGSAGQDRREQVSKGQGRTRQDRTGENKLAKGKTGQDRTGQDRTGEDRRGKDMLMK